MRFFQNSGLYPAYIPRLRMLAPLGNSFASQVEAFLDDRYGACHLLEPVLNRDSNAFFTNGDDDQLQRQWANERGMPVRIGLNEILQAQIEDSRSEVFYNMDPMRYGSDFVRKLPGCVRKSIAWRAAPSPSADFEAYDLIVCNFPSILDSYRQRGWRSAYFAPAHDPEMNAYAANSDRPVDVLFVGGYSRHHRQRALVLEAVAALREDRKVVFHLDRSRLTRLAESPIGALLPVSDHRRPPNISAVSAAPVFGRDLYFAISRSKIVLNGAVDMAGEDRGNMRCYEGMGCGALLVSDNGRYPDGMVDGHSMLTYADSKEAVNVISTVLREPARLTELAATGAASIRLNYSKQEQWLAFKKLVEST